MDGDKTAEALAEPPVPRAPPSAVDLNTSTGGCVRVQNTHKELSSAVRTLSTGWGRGAIDRFFVVLVVGLVLIR